MAEKVLITGALGQDGSLLAEYLASLGQEVVGVVRELPAGARTETVAGVRLLQADITDEAAWCALLSDWRPTRIYHLAAFHHSSQEQAGTAQLEAWNQMMRVNFQSTCALATAALKVVPETHLVFSASSQMYTSRDAVLEVDEATRREPATFYGHAKSLSMDFLSFLRRHKGLHASTAILFNHESPRRGPQFVTRKITRMAAAAKRGGAGRLELINVGARVDWSAAHDVVRALHLMAEAERADDYVVASGSLHTVRDVLDVAFGQVRLDWRAYIDYREDRAVSALVGRPDKIERVLGWRRTVGFERMIAGMVDADLAHLA
jgi:GDPmannose 4,6-dehydratase